IKSPAALRNSTWNVVVVVPPVVTLFAPRPTPTTHAFVVGNASRVTVNTPPENATVGLLSAPVVTAQLIPSAVAIWRSEEHTSELQSLMSNSLAVFSLKKK